MPDTHKNFAYSAIATAPSPASSGTLMVVTAGDGTKFPAVPFNATVWPSGAIPTTTNAEIVRVTAVATDSLTVTRAQEGSSARSIVVGDQIAATITTKTLTDAETSFGGVTATTVLGARGSSGLNTESMTTVADANYTATATDRVVAYTSVTTIRTVTLPAASAVNAGAPLTIINLTSSTNPIALARAGSDTVNGATSYAMVGAFVSVTLVSDGTSKWTLSALAENPLQPGHGGTGQSTVATAQHAMMALTRTTVANVNYTALTTDINIVYTSITAARTVSLMAAATAGANFFLVVKVESGSVTGVNTITIDPNGAETIDGSLTKVINAAFGSIRLYCNGTNWFTW